MFACLSFHQISDENYEHLSSAELRLNISNTSSFTIELPPFGNEMTFCEVITPSEQRLSYSNPRVKNEIRRWVQKLLILGIVTLLKKSPVTPFIDFLQFIFIAWITEV